MPSVYDKKRLFEMFEKVNGIKLKETVENPFDVEKVTYLNPKNTPQMIEFHTFLMSYGIAEIYDRFAPKWLIDKLADNGIIEEINNVWVFTDKGKEMFPTPQKLQKWLMGE